MHLFIIFENQKEYRQQMCDPTSDDDDEEVSHWEQGKKDESTTRTG
jgi:hypothetical protein